MSVEIKFYFLSPFFFVKHITAWLSDIFFCFVPYITHIAHGRCQFKTPYPFPSF